MIYYTMRYLSQTKSISQKKANILLTLDKNKSMEATATEKVFETGGMKPVSCEHTNAAKPEIVPSQEVIQPASGSPTEPTTEKVVAAPAKAETVEPEMSEDQFYTYVSQNTGLEIKSEDDLKKVLLEYKKYKDDPYGGVSNFVKEVIKAEKSGISPSRFIALSSLDYSSLSAKEVLFQEHLNKNPNYGQNVEFARKNFEREYRSNYGILSKEGMKREEFTGTDQEFEQLQDDIAFTREKLAYDSGVAKKQLEAIKAQALTPEPQQLPKTPAEIKAEQDRINAEIDQALSFDKLAIPLGEGEYELPVTDQEKAKIRNYMQDPLKAIKDLFGIDVGQQHTDQEKFSTALAYLLAYPKVGAELSKHAIESKNKEIVTTKLENPVTGVVPNRQTVSDEKETPGTIFRRLK